MKNIILTTRASQLFIRWFMFIILGFGFIQSPCFAQNSKDVKKAVAYSSVIEHPIPI